MVKLLLDVGNSRCKCAEYSADGSPDAFSWHPPVAVVGNDAPSCIPLQTKEEIVGILVASVRSDEFNHALSEALSARFRLHPVFVAAKRSACGVVTTYRNAADLGVDRFLALIGAWRKVGGACVIADCGTAVTVDAINRYGVHQGGLIIPGLRMLKESLSRHTDLLPVFSGSVGKAEGILFARDTERAITGGCHGMFVHSVTDAICRMQAALLGDVAVLVTGGDGEVLLESRSISAQYDPHLVLEGLAAFSECSVDCG